MGRKEKLLHRFLSKPKDFSYDELKRLLGDFGYSTARTGRASGSRVAFVQERTKHVIRLHKPHPSQILKRYQLDYIEEELRKVGEIK